MPGFFCQILNTTYVYHSGILYYSYYFAAQKQVKNMNASHTSQMVSHSTTWMVDGRAAVRLLAIRYGRVGGITVGMIL